MRFQDMPYSRIDFEKEEENLKKITEEFRQAGTWDFERENPPYPRGGRAENPAYGLEFAGAQTVRRAVPGSAGAPIRVFRPFLLCGSEELGGCRVLCGLQRESSGRGAQRQCHRHAVSSGEKLGYRNAPAAQFSERG